MTPEEIRQCLLDLEHFEGAIPWMYLDTRGLVTVGIGCMIPTVRDAVTYPFQGAQSGATAEEISEDFARVSRMPPGHASSFYRTPSSVTLLADDIRNITWSRLVGEFVPNLINLCHDFENFPPSAKRALVDMIWNLGQHGLAKFHHLLADVNIGSWRAAAPECHRSTCREERNAWCKNLFLQAGTEVAT